MIFVSLLVHEQPEVVVDTCKNFLSCLSNSRIILHLSKTATFGRNELMQKLIQNSLRDRVLINPNSVETSWGSIIQAHLCNADYISELSDKNDSNFICFHASNDLLIKKNLDFWIKKKGNIFHLREYETPNLWWPMREAFKDKKLIFLLKHLGLKDKLFGGQIEGSCYDLNSFLEIKNIIERSAVLEDNSVWYPREEIIFPSIAYTLGLKPEASPYIYSELHDIDYHSWKVWKLIDKYWKLPRGKNFAKREFYNFLVKAGIFSMTPNRVDQIRKSKFKDLYFDDGSSIWCPYPDKSGIYGVKRVKRDMTDKARTYIRDLTLGD